MGQDYSDEEIAIMDENVEQITNKWNEYVFARLNGNDGDMHNPPGLNRAISDMLEHVLVNMAQSGEILIGIDLFASFASNMFAFGQWATDNGLNMADLFHCKCTSISDDEIANFMKNHQEH